MGQSLKKAIIATKDGNATIVKNFVKTVDLNVLDEYFKGGTLLHFAVYAENLEIVRTLVEAGASTDLKTQSGFLQEIDFPFHLHGKFPLEIAILQQSAGIIEYLKIHTKTSNKRLLKYLIESLSVPPALYGVDPVRPSCGFSKQHAEDEWEVIVIEQDGTSSRGEDVSVERAPDESVSRQTDLVPDKQVTAEQVSDEQVSGEQVSAEQVSVICVSDEDLSNKQTHETAEFDEFKNDYEPYEISDDVGKLSDTHIISSNSNKQVELTELFTKLDINIEYVSKFLDEEIFVEDLPHLSDEDLKFIIPKLGPRKRLINYCNSPKSAPKNTKKSKFYYPVSHPKRGIALVIGNGNSSKVQSSCHQDSVVMRDAFQKIGYDVHHFTDLSANEILLKARGIKMLDHSSFDSFVMFFSGHGTSNAIYGGIGQDLMDVLEICDLVDMFQPRRCPTLAGKPKVFLWDCCRGDRSDKSRGGYGGDFIPPQYGDYLYGYATAAQFKSYIGRHGTTNGMSIWTYFLHKNLKELPDSHLTEILTIVQNDVVEYARAHGRKQAANHVSYLTKFVEV